MRGIVSIAPLAAAVAVVAACGSGSASSSSKLDSGIRGRAFLGPTCPVETVPPSPNCKPKPLAVGIAVLRASDRRRVATTRSGRDGRFVVRVRPGRYYLSGSSKKRPFARTVLTTVHAHRFAHIRITFDSGIR